MNAYSNLIHNCQELETTPTSSNWRNKLQDMCTRWVNIKCTTLSEKSQIREMTYCTIPLYSFLEEAELWR